MVNMKRELELMAANEVDPAAPRAKRRKEASAASPDNTADMQDVKVEEGAEGGGEGGGQTLESVREQGMQIWKAVKDAVSKEGRALSLDFMRLPSRRQYPDYYQLIKRPMALDDIRAQLQRGQYISLDLVKTDLEQVFVNAKRYNLRDSQIWKDAKALHKIVKKEYARITGTAEEEPGDGGEKAEGEGSDNERDKKSKKAPNMTRLLKSRLQKLVEKTDDSGRVLSEEFMELPNKKLWALYYKAIKRPQCLENIFKHLKRKEYHTSAEFARDVELVFSNALEFNQDHTPIWEDALTLRDYFRKLMSDLPAPYALPEYASPEKPAAAQPSTKIKLKMPAAGQPSAAHGPSAEKASPPLTLRVPNGGQSSPPVQSQTTDSAKTKPPALAPLAPATQAPTPIAPRAPGVSGLQIQPAPAQAGGTSQVAAVPAPYHYANATYPHAGTTTTMAAAALGPAPSPVGSNPPAQQATEKTASTSPAPPPALPKSQLRHISLSTSPVTRRIDLDVEDGVKSWAMRLTTGERAVTVKDVSFLEEKERRDEKGEEHEQAEPGKDTKGKGKAKGASKKKDETPADPKPSVNGKAAKGPEALQVLLNGSLVKSMQGSEWHVELPVGSSTLELGEQGGAAWKVYFDRPPL
ncbi:Bromodomain-containing protein [Heliocybe sulcata]|uniref:Bromodomain-containing protein n=1 Tax=Heliocybe sulcata TaxID=5364 RepID=A0A5C3NGV0_9AGAM|nr:Bromodomain-containing protein [Heliocybe sulcata]